MPDSIESRVAVAIESIHVLQREVQRNRESIHELQSTVRGVEMLTRQVAELHENLPALARQAARDAVSEFWQRRHADTLRNWSVYAAIASVGVALGALIVSLIHFH